MSGEATRGAAPAKDQRCAPTDAYDLRADWADGVRSALLGWYVSCKRDLPWRDTGDPYAVWVSEVMLQQTRVSTAEGYFNAWMARFPDVQALADSHPDAVLGAWQGLGYYRRARNLHAAASRIVDEHGGNVPSTVEELMRLPGIGEYTAGAVASIAFGVPVPAVDGNARRVLARVCGERGDPRRGASARRVRSAAAALADCDRPGDVNQAVMELGARVCTPRGPACESCPVAAACVAYGMGWQAEIPDGARGTKPRTERVTALALRDTRGRLLVARRRENVLLGGLWELPMVASKAGDGPRAGRPEPLGLAAADLVAVGQVEHAFTHIRLTVDVLVGRLTTAGSSSAVPPLIRETPGEADDAPWGPHVYADFRWVTRAELAALATSVLMNKLVRLAEASDGG